MTYQFNGIKGFYPSDVNDIRFVVSGKSYDSYGREVSQKQFYCRDLYSEILLHNLKKELDSWIKKNSNCLPVDVEIEFWENKISNCKDFIWLKRYNENLDCAKRTKKGMEIQGCIETMNQKAHKMLKLGCGERERKFNTG